MLESLVGNIVVVKNLIAVFYAQEKFYVIIDGVCMCGGGLICVPINN